MTVGTKVLLVSPCRFTEQIQGQLQSLGCELLYAENGLRFISHLDVEDPDVVIMDAQPAWCDPHVLCRTVTSSRPSKPVFVLAHEESEYDVFKDISSAQVFHMPRQMGQLVRKVRQVSRAL